MCAVSTSMETAAESPPGYHHGNLREALVAAGLAHLDAGRSPDFSLRELTRQVGVSANAAYRHFASKEDLLIAMALEGFRRLTLEQASALQAQASLAAGFMAAGRAYVAFAQRHPALFRLMFGRFVASNGSEELRAAARMAYDGMRHCVAAVLVRPVDDAQVEVAAAHTWSVIHGLGHLLIDGQFDTKTADIERLIEAVLQYGDKVPPPDGAAILPTPV